MLHHLSDTELRTLWTANVDAGEGWGLEADTPEQAMEREQATLVRAIRDPHDGSVLAVLNDVVYVVCDCHGPWAVPLGV